MLRIFDESAGISLEDFEKLAELTRMLKWIDIKSWQTDQHEDWIRNFIERERDEDHRGLEEPPP